MHSETNDCNCTARCAYVIAILGASCIVAVLVLLMRHYTQTPPPNGVRAAERAKTLADLRAAEHDAMTSPGWIDEGKGIVRLKVDDAVTMVTLWRDPAMVRSNLLVRVDKANPPPPPPPKNPFD